MNNVDVLSGWTSARPRNRHRRLSGDDSTLFGSPTTVVFRSPSWEGRTEPLGSVSHEVTR